MASAANDDDDQQPPGIRIPFVKRNVFVPSAGDAHYRLDDIANDYERTPDTAVFRRDRYPLSLPRPTRNRALREKQIRDYHDYMSKVRRKFHAHPIVKFAKLVASSMRVPYGQLLVSSEDDKFFPPPPEIELAVTGSVERGGLPPGLGPMYSVTNIPTEDERRTLQPTTGRGRGGTVEPEFQSTTGATFEPGKIPAKQPPNIFFDVPDYYDAGGKERRVQMSTDEYVAARAAAEMEYEWEAKLQRSRAKVYETQMKWLDRPAVDGDLYTSSVLYGGMELALSKLQSHDTDGIAGLSNVRSADAFVMCTDRVVPTYFARLVSLEIALSENIIPQGYRKEVDYVRIHQRETMLIRWFTRNVYSDNQGRVHRIKSGGFRAGSRETTAHLMTRRQVVAGYVPVPKLL